MRFANRPIPVIIVLLGPLLVFALSGCERPEPRVQPAPPADAVSSPGNPGTAARGNACAALSTDAAAGILGVSADGLMVKAEQGYEGFWQCSFRPPDGDRSIAFSVTIAKDARTAAGDMEQLRENLELAGSTAAFRENLPQGAYSDISGVGDEAVWTDVNGTLTVRKGNISIQVLQPPGKLDQIKVAEAFLAGR